MPRLTSSEEHAAFEVARHLVEYRGYAGSPATAIRALQRRLGGVSKSRATRLLELGVRLLEVSKKVVAERETEMWEVWDPRRLQIAGNRLGKEVRDALPQFSRRVCDLAVAWVFYQHYLR